MRISFKYRFILSFLTIEVVFISLIVFFNFTSLNRLSHSLIDEKIETGTTLFSEMVKTPLSVYDLGTIDNQIGSFINLKNIVAVKVFDTQKRLLSGSVKNNNVVIDRYSGMIKEDIRSDGRTYRLIRAPVTMNDEVLGSVTILFDLTESLQTIEKNRNLTFLLILIEIVISSFVAYVIGYRLTRALVSLTLSAERLDQDDQVMIPDIGNNGDEISILSHTLHMMQQRIAERNNNFNDIVHKLEDSTTQLQLLLDSMSEGVYGVDTEGICTFVNRSFLKILGYEKAEEVLGKSIHELIHHSHADGTPYPRAECVMLSAFQGVQTHMSNEVFWNKHGTAIPVEYWSNPIMIDDKLVGAMATFVDISKRKATEYELYKLSQAIEQSPNAVVITDLHGNIEYVNTAFCKITGYSLSELVGNNPRLLHSGKTPSATYKEMWEHLSRGERWQGEFINRYKDGMDYIQSVNISPICQSDGKITHYMAMQEDITERKRSEERIHYLANFDLLTGLPNRAQMEDRFKYILSLTKRNKGNFTIMFLDLDHFKYINDTLGHSFGDALLVEMAQRMSEVLREEDTLSRLGGDEFILLLPNTDTNGAEQVAQKLLNAIIQPFVIKPHELAVSASIGIAIYPADGSDIETLSKNADAAMYRAKQGGRNNYCFFTKEMQIRSTRNLQLSNALRHALEYKELYLVYQPQVSVVDGSVIGAEALLRWEHPDFGTISPAEFIPIAEDSGLILSIGEWVLCTAAKQAKIWMDKGLSPIIMAVNLSAVQFRQTGLPDLVARVLEEVHLSAEYLELELTEGVAMHDPQSAISMMNDLYDLGIRMSIDDFGTGYSSLSYLKKFKVYKLKIDQSFVHDIGSNPEDKAIVSAVINMAHSLGLQTIAEGVESLCQLDYLREQGCDEVQGYYFSKPLLPDAFEALIREKETLRP